MTLLKELQDFCRERFGGTLYSGRHNPDSQACVLELESQRRNLPWSDSPAIVRCFDVRPLNDAPWSSNEVRTQHMLRLLAAMSGSLGWPRARQRQWAEIVALETVRQIVSSLPGLPADIATQCRGAGNQKAAAASAADAAWAAWAAWAAARAAEDAARAARAAGDAVLIVACDIWINAAEQTKEIT